ncbi:hypothetical protein, unlikely [Trypanosoma brucei brucei TREU927]|uniref:T. brucei spp.-specific protein n=1 Tax=Trypanosoma brucei brucei (strain 927/4 GUTat10.1) TaxID=185431 RepID=Q4GY97_TRYB2|nr:hypothetical protein, unlikely [Trypanosoma brucei brucei TREU927]CAJ16688.1 hypothetical protein, unlikely [Trypanosoma brucei brucei TREU927]
MYIYMCVCVQPLLSFILTVECPPYNGLCKCLFTVSFFFLIFGRREEGEGGGTRLFLKDFFKNFYFHRWGGEFIKVLGATLTPICISFQQYVRACCSLFPAIIV